MSQFSKKLTYLRCKIWLGLFLMLSFTTPIFALDQSEKDDICSSDLLGTMTAESCSLACTAPAYECAYVKKISKGDYPSLTEDLSCFTCRKQQCSDFGLVDATGKAFCDAQPDKKSIPALPLADGTPCWQCVNKADTCSDRWPGSAVLATCQAGCPAPNFRCVKLGQHDGQDCYTCTKNLPPPPPPQQCTDLGFISFAQCATACTADEECLGAGVATATGQMCFQCVKKKKNCKKMGKANHSICNQCANDGKKCVSDGVAENGEQCYKCEDKDCKDINKKNNAICTDCEAKDGKCIPNGNAPSGEACFKCEKKDCKDIGLNDNSICQQCREDGGSCKYVKQAPNRQLCYECDLSARDECPNGTIPGLCGDNSCSAYEDCANVPQKNCHTCKHKECPEGGSAGLCTAASCYADEVCVNMSGDCHRCIKKYTGCEEGTLEGLCQAGSCPDGQYCSNTPRGCHICTPLPDDKQCTDGYAPGPCPASCSSDQDCREIPGPCHICQPKVQNCSDLNLLDIADCISCDSNPKTQCVQVSRTSSGWPCFECRPKEGPNDCASREMFSSCNPNPCREDEICIPDPWSGWFASSQQCYMCDKKESYECTAYGYQSWVDCISSCQYEGYQCVGVGMTTNGVECFECMAKDGGRCPPPSFEQAGCTSCWENGLWCDQVSTTNEGVLCYQCRQPTNDDNDCAYYELFSSCTPNPCWEGEEICVPVPVTGKDIQCYGCEKRPRTEDDCDYHELYTSCDSCWENQDCVPVQVGTKPTTCYECRTRPDCRGIGKYNEDICPQCPEGNQECVPDGMAPDGEPCYKCENIKLKECKDMNLLQLEDCIECDHNPETECVEVARDEKGWPCFECRKKNRPKDCGSYQMFESCSPFPCREDEECIQKSSKNDLFFGVGLDCYGCEKKDKRICSEADLMDWNTCQEWCYGDDRECVPIFDPEIEASCYDCVMKDKGRCKEPTFEERGCYSCWNAGLDCKAVSTANDGTRCFECIEKNENSCTYAGYWESCTPNPCWEGKEICEMVNVPGTELQCAECKEKPITEDDCEFYEMLSSCDPNPCWEDEECVMTKAGTGNKQIDCAQCQKKKNCEDIGKLNNAACDNCREQGGECIPAGGAPNGEACYDCMMPKNCAEEGLMNQEACELECHGDDTRECVEVAKAKSGEQCYSCLTKDSYLCERAQLLPGGCPACGDDEKCVEKSPEGYRAKCHVCEKLPPPPPKCIDGLIEGVCPGNCSSDQKCVAADDDCYSCQPKDCDDYGLLNSCVICDVEGDNCVEKSPRSGLTCYECEENPCKPNLTKDQCAECENQGGICQSLTSGTRQRGTQECFKCVPKPPECPQGTSQGVCTQSSCSSEQECVTVGENCHRCQKKKKTCVEMGLNYGDECIQMCAPLGGKCKQKTQDDFGMWCWECSKTSVTTSQCDQGYQQGSCPGSCHSNQECVQAGECYACQQKSVTESCDDGFLPGACAPGVCPSGYDCYGHDKNQNCHICEVEIVPIQCPQGATPGVCSPSACSSDQECVAVGDDCHRCQKKRQTCVDMGLNYGDECIQMCAPLGGKCKQKTQDDFGMWCWECSKTPVTTPQCDQGYQAGTCTPSTCSSDYECVQAGECYSCKEKPRTSVQCPSGFAAGNCTQDSCASNETCYQDPQYQGCHKCQQFSTTTKLTCPQGFSFGGCPGLCSYSGEGGCFEEKGCHKCGERPKTSVQCPSGFAAGNCTQDSCASNETCYQDPQYQGCHKCQQFSTTTKLTCPQGFSFGRCPGFCLSGDECVEDKGCYQCKGKPTVTDGGGGTTTGWVPGGGGVTTGGTGGLPPIGDMCPSPSMTGVQCGFACEARGGVCTPLSVRSKAGFPCFACASPEADCDYIGEVCSCMECYQNEICVPGTIIANPDNPRERFLCKRCIPRLVMLREMIYLVMLIESPLYRLVLSDQDAGGFKPASVMALVDQASAKAMGLVGGALSVESLAKTLSEGLSKGGDYGESCFNGFSQAQQEEDVPPASSSLGSSQGSSQEYGKKSEEKLKTSAPIISCGTFEGKKALAIYDSHGTPVTKIFKEDLEKNPFAIQEAIAHAQALIEQAQAASQGGIQGLVQKAAQAAVKTLVKKAVDTLKKGGEKTSTTPNDPLYMPPEEEKKKGIFGSNTKPKVLLGANMRMGGQDLSQGSGTPVKDKFVAKDQWAIQKVGYLPKTDPNSAWNVFEDKERNVVVAVIDSGFDFEHPDGPEYVWQNPGEMEIPNGMDDDNNGYVDDINGWNFIDDTNILTDTRGHGTFVAGIIAAKSDNGMGIAGINPGAIIMPLKVADTIGETNSFNISRAIYYAVNNGARIINISLGGRGISQLEEAALRYADEMGVFVAVASGNVNENIDEHGPASTTTVFAVGAIDYNGTRSAISNFGANNGLLAPGEQVYSIASKDTKDLLPSLREFGYYTQDGTSFSTPMVTATASLMLAKNPGLTHKQIRDILLQTADDLGEPGWDGENGAGLLNAKRALEAVQPSSVTLTITEASVVRDKKDKMIGVDVSLLVRGPADSTVIEAGKGKFAKKFEQIAGPFRGEIDNKWVARIDTKEYLKGSSTWVIRAVAKDKNGKEFTAQTIVELK